MMRLAVMSDFQADVLGRDGVAGWLSKGLGSEIDADACIIAGDACPPLMRSVRFLLPLAERMPVIYVPGNRDFYSSLGYPSSPLGMDEDVRQAKEFEDRGLYVLQNDALILDGVRFIGSTLWADLEPRDPLDSTGDALGTVTGGQDATPTISALLNDFRQILIAEGTLMEPADYVRLHGMARTFIESELAAPFSGPSVVISHHAPHPRSIAEFFRGNPLNGAFASDLEEIFDGPNAPVLWVHGSMHRNCDYVVGSTRVISNSLGYPFENPDFDPGFVIDLPEWQAAPRM